MSRFKLEEEFKHVFTILKNIQNLKEKLNFENITKDAINMKKLLYILSILLIFKTNILMSDNTFKSNNIVEKPAPITFISRCDTDGLSHGVSIKGKYAYVADGFAGLKIIDISNHKAPIIVGSYYGGESDLPIINSAKKVVIRGKYAYIATSFTGLQIIDITNPIHPTFVGKVFNEVNSGDLALKGNYAYVVDDGIGEIQIINISNPASPIVVNTYKTHVSGVSIDISKNYAYIAGFNGLEIIDISNPASPIYISKYDTGVSFGVQIKGKYAYVSGSYAERLHILDISNPASPKSVSTSPKGFAGSGISISNNYAYLSHVVGELNIIDISNPTSPKYVGTYDTPSSSGDAVTSIGNYIYIGNGSNGLTIIKLNIKDTDNDGIADNIDLDDDNDGISDSDEITLGFNPLNEKDGLADYDRDGFCNAMEFNIGTKMNNFNDKPIWTPIQIDTVVTFIPTKP